MRKLLPFVALLAACEAQSREILNNVRQACAPNSPSIIECKSEDGLGGDREACHLIV